MKDCLVWTKIHFLLLTLILVSLNDANAKMLFSWGNPETLNKILSATPPDDLGRHVVNSDTAQVISMNSRSISDAGKGLYLSDQAAQYRSRGSALMILEVPDNYSIPSEPVWKLKSLNQFYFDGKIPPLTNIGYSSVYLLVNQPKNSQFILHLATAKDAEAFWKQNRSLETAIQELANLSVVLRVDTVTPDAQAFARTVLEGPGYSFLLKLDVNQLTSSESESLHQLLDSLKLADFPSDKLDALRSKVNDHDLQETTVNCIKAFLQKVGK